MPLLATVTSHFSHLLHRLVYSFPSPNATASSTADYPAPPGSGKLQSANEGYVSMHGSLEDLVSEPGEPRALAGGIGPLSFAGSGYGIMLVLMAILLNRIHHIVRRPRPPPPPMPHPPIDSWYYRARRSLSQMLTSPSTPAYLRLPGLVSLFRAWMLFTILTLQVADFWPVNSPWLLSTRSGRALNRWGEWAGNMEMEKVCWQVFLSVCAGLVCSGLANGLDRGRRRDVGAGFNLFGYSFLLHLYSSPLTHHRPPPAASQGRPDVHALFQLWLSLTELTWLQTIELSPRVRRNQLLPTAVCGGLGLAHFVYALLTSPLKFPSFTFLTHLLALFLFVVIFFSIILKGITHIFTLGYLPSPIFRNLLPHDGVVPSIEDDFGVALLKLGTACIEATQYSGLRNELASIEERQGPWVELSASGVDVFKGAFEASGGFSHEITDVDVTEIEDPQRDNAYFREVKTFWRALSISLAGFAYSLMMATPIGRKVIDMSQKAWHGRWWYGPRQWRFWRREAWREPPHLRQRAALRILEQVARRAAVVREDNRRRAADATDSEGVSTAIQLRREGTPQPLGYDYAQFLRGDIDVADDEEAEWVDDDEDGSSASSSASDEEEEQALYRDLMAPPSADLQPTSDLQPVLLAHLTSQTSSPLTRRRYAAILSSPAHGASPSSGIITPSGLMDVIAERRGMAPRTEDRDDWDEDRRRCCVVCTVEPRDTILWPCRCLALCNDCRESLAARLGAKDHMCPCCRRKVEGYSRIYIP